MLTIVKSTLKEYMWLGENVDANGDPRNPIG